MSADDLDLDLDLDIDFTFSDLYGDLGGISELEVRGRGRTPSPLDDALVVQAHRRVVKTGILERLARWRAEDTPPAHMGGRPALISDEALLTGLMLLAKEGAPLHLTRVAELFQYRLSDSARELLDLERPSTTFVGHVGEQRRWFHNTHRAFHRIHKLLDPFPQERRESKTYTALQDILDNHDPVLEAKRKTRLNEYTAAFLMMTYREQPRAIRRASRQLDLSFDQTYVGPPTTKQYSRKTLQQKVQEEARNPDDRTRAPGPVDAFIGWHITTGDRVDNPRGSADMTTPKGFNGKDARWGWDLTLAVRVDSKRPGTKRTPALVLGATLSLPNINVAEEAVVAMTAATATGLRPGLADADRQYWANATVERLHDPAAALGFTPSTAYRKDRLGVRGGDHGALYIEGSAYCPGTPKALQDASKDSVSGTIDIATYRARIKERQAFELHVKEKPDGKGRTVLRCPALGPSPTVTCPLRELLKTVTPRERPGVDPDDVPDFADKICKQHSVSFDTANMRREKQGLTYGTPEWERFHSHARNSIESTNQQLKSGGTEDIESASRRRVRGLGAAQIMLTVLLANFNIRKIAAFISDKIKEDAKASPADPDARAPIRRRDRDWHNPYTGTYPAGVARPNTVKLAPSDETGGPPLRS